MVEDESVPEEVAAGVVVLVPPVCDVAGLPVVDGGPPGVPLGGPAWPATVVVALEEESVVALEAHPLADAAIAITNRTTPVRTQMPFLLDRTMATSSVAPAIVSVRSLPSHNRA